MIWRRRVPLWVLRLAVAVPLTLLVVVEIATTDPCTVTEPCRDALQPGDYWLGALVVAWALLGIPLALRVPRVAPWPATVVAVAQAVAPASESPVRPVWALAAVAWAVLGAADLLLCWRQRVLADGWSGVHVRLPPGGCSSPPPWRWSGPPSPCGCGPGARDGLGCCATAGGRCVSEWVSGRTTSSWAPSTTFSFGSRWRPSATTSGSCATC